jgi:hypothetical protein
MLSSDVSKVQPVARAAALSQGRCREHPNQSDCFHKKEGAEGIRYELKAFQDPLSKHFDAFGSR